MNCELCDICGKTTYVYPPSEQVYEEIEISVPGLDTVVTQKVPKLKKVKQMNPITFKMEEKSIPVLKDLKPRSFMIILDLVGQTQIKRDFCEEHFELIRPEFEALYEKLASLDPVG